MEGKVKCSGCGWSWNKSDSSKKDMYVCHQCGKDNTMKNGGWLNKYDDGGVQPNYNDASVSMSDDFVGLGYDTKGRNYSPAWGGQFEDGGIIPIAQSGVTEYMNKKMQEEKDKGIAAQYNLPEVVVQGYRDASPFNQAGRMSQYNPSPTVPYLEKTKDPAEFFKSWITSPEYRRRKIETGYAEYPEYSPVTGDESDDPYKGPLIDRAMRNNFLKLQQLQRPGAISYDPKIRSEYFETSGEANIRPQDFDKDNTVLAHEIAHAVDTTEGDLSQKELDILSSSIEGWGKRLPDSLSPELWSKVQYAQHLEKPRELRADLNALRFLMYDKDIYDIRKGKEFTKEDLERAKEKLKGNKSLDRTLMVTGDDNLIKLMNIIAKGDEELTPIAMNGTSMPGSVGFTYARTAGSAPSKGKYAKKTMASAQKGKNDIEKISIDDPRYPEMYKNRQVGLSYDDAISLPDLPEVTITAPRSYTMDSLRDFTKAALYGAPATAMKLEQIPTAALAETAAMLTGKPYNFSNLNPNLGQFGSNQRDLSILGYENPQGFLQNAANTALSAIDPALVTGVTSVLKKSLQKGAKQISKEVLDRRVFLQDLKDKKLIHPDTDINKYSKSLSDTEELTKKALTQRETYYRGVTPKIPEGPEQQLIIEEMKKAGVDISNPEDVGRYMATHVPFQKLDYNAGFATNDPRYNALYTSDGFSRYGDMTFEMTRPLDFSKGSYSNWLDDLYKYPVYNPSEKIDDLPLFTRAYALENRPGPGVFVGTKGQKIFDDARLVTDDYGRIKSKPLPGIDKQRNGGYIPSAQNGQEMKFYQNGLDWKPRSMQNGGEEEMYVELPEVTITPDYDEQYPFYQSLSNEQKKYINDNGPIGRATRALAITGKRGQTASDISNVVRDVEKFGYEASGVPGTIRFADDPLKNLTGTGKTLLDLGLLAPSLALSGFAPIAGEALYGALGGINPITGEKLFDQQNLQGSFNTLDALGLSLLATPLVKPVGMAAKTVGKVAGQIAQPHLTSISNVANETLDAVQAINNAKKFENLSMVDVPVLPGIDKVKDFRNFGREVEELNKLKNNVKLKDVGQVNKRLNELRNKAKEFQSAGIQVPDLKILDDVSDKLKKISDFKVDDFIEKMKKLGADEQTLLALKSKPDVAVRYSDRINHLDEVGLADEFANKNILGDVLYQVTDPSYGLSKISNFKPQLANTSLEQMDPTTGNINWGSTSALKRVGNKIYEQDWGADKFYSYPFYKNIGDKIVDTYSNLRLSGSPVISSIPDSSKAFELMPSLSAANHNVGSMLRQASRFIDETPDGLMFPARSLSGDSYPLGLNMMARELKNNPDSQLRLMGFGRSNFLGFADQMNNPELLRSELSQIIKGLEDLSGQSLPKPYVLKNKNVDDVIIPKFAISKGSTNEMIQEYLKNSSIAERLGVKRPVYQVSSTPNVPISNPPQTINFDPSDVNYNFKNGGITKDNRGYWNPNNWGKPVEIDSNNITMQGVYEPLIGISDTGDTKLMKPGKNYKFKGKKVTEYPVAKLGINQLDAQPMKKLNQLLNFTNNPDKNNWLDKYN